MLQTSYWLVLEGSSFVKLFAKSREMSRIKTVFARDLSSWTSNGSLGCPRAGSRLVGSTTADIACYENCGFAGVWCKEKLWKALSRCAVFALSQILWWRLSILPSKFWFLGSVFWANQCQEFVADFYFWPSSWTCVFLVVMMFWLIFRISIDP